MENVQPALLTLFTTHTNKDVTVLSTMFSTVDDASLKLVFHYLQLVFQFHQETVLTLTPSDSLVNVSADKLISSLVESVFNALMVPSTTLLLEFVVSHVEKMKPTMLCQENADAHLMPTESMELVLYVLVKPNLILILELVSVLLVRLLMPLETAILDVESTKFSKMESAAAKLGSIQSMVSVDNAHGTKSMTKLLVFVESLVMPPEFSISALKNASVCLISSSSKTDHVEYVLFTQLTTNKAGNVPVMQDLSNISVFASLNATNMKSTLMENASAEKDMLSLVIPAEPAHQLRPTILFTDSVKLPVVSMKSGTLRSDHADANLDILSSMVSAASVMDNTKSTTRRQNVVTV